jgi:hypothetical protein
MVWFGRDRLRGFSFPGRQVIDRTSDHQRLQLQFGVNFRFDRPGNSKTQSRCHDHIAVAPHQRNILFAKRLSQRFGSLRVVDEHIVFRARHLADFKYRHAAG